MSSALNPFAIAQQQLDEAAQYLGLSPGMHAFLRQPMHELSVSIPVRMDDGGTQVFSGFRVQYNNALGPFKGGVRFHPDETIDAVRALAAWMTWKCSVLGLPLGGAKGGVVCDPGMLSLTELERLSRGYAHKIAPLIGEGVDILAPDVYTTPQTMAWMVDEYSARSRRRVLGVATGKPVPLGGSLGRSDATGRGGIYCLREALRLLNIAPSDATVAIQGFGNAGFWAAKLAHEMGIKVVAVADVSGGIYNPAGLNVPALAEHVESQVKRLTEGYKEPGSGKITHSELLELPVTAVIPAALGNVITKDNATRIRAQIVAELANGPTTPEADAILFEKAVYVIPDFLCNGGGVIVSYLEQVQNQSNLYWNEDAVHGWLEKIIVDAFNRFHSAQQEYKVRHRLAAYLAAVRRVAEAVKIWGWCD